MAKKKKHNSPVITSGPTASQKPVDEAAMNAMMKARLAYAQMHGNPAAQRLVAPIDNYYQFPNGDMGSHYMSSMDNYAVPQIQNENGQLQLGDYGPRSNEAIRFDSDKDANYFAEENYKKISPAFQQQMAYGGGIPPIVPTWNYPSKGTPIYRNTSEVPPSFAYGGSLSKMGYRDDSPYRNEPFIDITTPTGIIDMSQTGIPLMANGQYLAPYSGQHQMGTTQVREVPVNGVALKQWGGGESNTLNSNAQAAALYNLTKPISKPRTYDPVLDNPANTPRVQSSTRVAAPIVKKVRTSAEKKKDAAVAALEAEKRFKKNPKPFYDAGITDADLYDKDGNYDFSAVATKMYSPEFQKTLVSNFVKDMKAKKDSLPAWKKPLHAAGSFMADPILTGGNYLEGKDAMFGQSVWLNDSDEAQKLADRYGISVDDIYNVSGENASSLNDAFKFVNPGAYGASAVTEAEKGNYVNSAMNMIPWNMSKVTSGIAGNKLLNKFDNAVKNSTPGQMFKSFKNGLVEISADTKKLAQRVADVPSDINSTAQLVKSYKKLKKQLNTPEGKRRLKLMDIDPNDLELPTVTAKRDGSFYRAIDNLINVDPKEVRWLSKKYGKKALGSNKTVFEHEVGHWLQREASRQSNEYKDAVSRYMQVNNDPKSLNALRPVAKSKPTKIDKYLEEIEHNIDVPDEDVFNNMSDAAKDDFLSDNQDYLYFMNSKEAFPHGREMRQGMVNSGIIKHPYDPISKDQIMTYMVNTPKDRITSFATPNQKNVDILYNFMNNAPAAIPAVGAAGAIGIAGANTNTYGGILGANANVPTWHYPSPGIDTSKEPIIFETGAEMNNEDTVVEEVIVPEEGQLASIPAVNFTGGPDEKKKKYFNIKGVNKKKLKEWYALGKDAPTSLAEAKLLAEAVGYTSNHANIVAAQWALESTHGKNVGGSYNYFGIKSHSKAVRDRLSNQYGLNVSANTPTATGEQDKVGNEETIDASFLNFEDPIAAFLGHKAFLETNNIYANALKEKSSYGFAKGIADAGYATGINYLYSLGDISKPFIKEEEYLKFPEKRAKGEKAKQGDLTSNHLDEYRKLPFAEKTKLARLPKEMRFDALEKLYTNNNSSPEQVNTNIVQQSNELQQEHNVTIDPKNEYIDKLNVDMGAPKKMPNFGQGQLFKTNGGPLQYQYGDTMLLQKGGRLSQVAKAGNPEAEKYLNIPGVNKKKMKQWLALNQAEPSSLRDAQLLAEAVGYTPEQSLVVASQWAFESGGGSHLSSPYNYFGIKSHGNGVQKAIEDKYGISVGSGPQTKTKEFLGNGEQTIDDSFMTFDNAIESFIGHKAFLETNDRYKDSLAAKTSKDFAQGLQNAGYATVKDNAGKPSYARKLADFYSPMQKNPEYGNKRSEYWGDLKSSSIEGQPAAIPSPLRSQHMYGGNMHKNGGVLAGIGAGLYGLTEGVVDTLSFGLTDGLTDKGYEAIFDETNATDGIRGIGNTIGGVGGSIVNPAAVGSGISQAGKGIGDTLGATGNEDLAKVGQGIDQAAGLAGMFVNPGEAAGGKVAQGLGKLAGSPAGQMGIQGANQMMGMIPGVGQYGGNFQQFQDGSTMLPEVTVTAPSPTPPPATINNPNFGAQTNEFNKWNTGNRNTDIFTTELSAADVALYNRRRASEDPTFKDFGATKIWGNPNNPNEHFLMYPSPKREIPNPALVPNEPAKPTRVPRMLDSNTGAPLDPAMYPADPNQIGDRQFTNVFEQSANTASSIDERNAKAAALKARKAELAGMTEQEKAAQRASIDYTGGSKRYGGNLFNTGGIMNNGGFGNNNFNEIPVTKFNGGGKHAENPNGGIPQGKNPNGQVNLVEEGELKFPDPRDPLGENQFIVSADNKMKFTKSLVEKYDLPKQYVGQTVLAVANKILRKGSGREGDTIEENSKKLDLIPFVEAHSELTDIMKAKEEQAFNADMANMMMKHPQMMQQMVQGQPQQQPMGQPGGMPPMPGGMPGGQPFKYGGNKKYSKPSSSFKYGSNMLQYAGPMSTGAPYNSNRTDAMDYMRNSLRIPTTVENPTITTTATGQDDIASGEYVPQGTPNEIGYGFNNPWNQDNPYSQFEINPSSYGRNAYTPVDFDASTYEITNEEHGTTSETDEPAGKQTAANAIAQMLPMTANIGMGLFGKTDELNLDRMNKVKLDRLNADQELREAGYSEAGLRKAIASGSGQGGTYLANLQRLKGMSDKNRASIHSRLNAQNTAIGNQEAALNLQANSANLAQQRAEQQYAKQAKAAKTNQLFTGLGQIGQYARAQQLDDLAMDYNREYSDDFEYDYQRAFRRNKNDDDKG